MGLKVEFRNYFGISRPKEDFNLIWTICFLNHMFRVIYLGSYIFAKSFQNYAGGYVPTIFSYQKQPPEVFCKKGVLRNSASFTGKYLCWSLFLVMLTQVFSRDYSKICKSNYFEEHLRTAASVLSLATPVAKICHKRGCLFNETRYPHI